MIATLEASRIYYRGIGADDWEGMVDALERLERIYHARGLCSGDWVLRVGTEASEAYFGVMSAVAAKFGLYIDTGGAVLFLGVPVWLRDGGVPVDALVFEAAP